MAHVKFSSLFGHLPKLEDLQVAPAFTVSEDLPATNKFRLILDPGCQQHDIIDQAELLRE